MFKKWNDYKFKLPTFIRISVEIIEFILILIIIAIVIRQGFFERRYIPSESMLPYLQVGDQLIVEKISLNAQKLGIKKDGFQRGDVIVFYPPFIELNQGFLHKLARGTGFSSDINMGRIKPFFFMPSVEDAYIKRIIGLPGDVIEVKANKGVYINGERLLEVYPNSQGSNYFSNEYPLEKPFYSISKIFDLKEYFPDKSTLSNNLEIKVPENNYFCLGDNRNNSKDGHVWGFVPKDRIIGRAWVIIWRDLNKFKPRLINSIEEENYNKIQELRRNDSQH